MSKECASSLQDGGALEGGTRWLDREDAVKRTKKWSASVILWAVVLLATGSGEGSTSAADCADWHSWEFFKVARVEDVA